MTMLSLCSFILIGSLQTAETPGSLVTKMLAKYASAQTMVGSIKYTVSGTNLGVDTEFQFEKPNKLYILQNRRSSEPKQFLIVSDGKKFGYPLPDHVYTGSDQRLYESAQVNNKPIDLREIYRIVSASLADRNIGLDIAISRLENLKFLRNQWSSMSFAPEQPSDGTKRIVGSWRENASSPASGTYEMFVTPEGEIKKYLLRQTIMPDTTIGPQQIESVWSLDLKIDAKVNSALFNLR